MTLPAAGRQTAHSPLRKQHSRWAMVRRSGFALNAATLLALAACGDDSNSDDGDESTATTEPAPTTTTTHPSATEDEAEAFAIVEDIFYERGELIDDLYQNPELIDDPDSTHIERLRELTIGTTADHVDTLIDNVQTMVEHGHRQEATGTVMSDSAIANLSAEDPETITFDLCVMDDYQVVDEDGEPLYDPTALATFGVGEAQLVDGYWRIAEVLRDPRISLDSDMLEPGYLEPGMCEVNNSELSNDDGTAQ